MSKSDTWPRHIASEPLSNMDSAGSCDSVISMNSAYSEDSMEHLSPEERACLMYLQETIDSLEVQDDSGLSNEEPDHGSFADDIKDSTSLKSDVSESYQKSPLITDIRALLHNRVKETATTTPPVENDTENEGLNHSSEPEATSASADAARGLDAVDLGAGAGPSVPEVAGAPDLLLPPSDFMDEPNGSARPEKLKYRPPSVVMHSSKPGVNVDVEQIRRRAVTPTVNLEQLRQRAEHRKASLVPSLSEEYPSKPPFDIPPSPSPSALSLGPPVSPSPPLSPLPEIIEPKTPPAVAPKPKVLPAMILLKSQKTAPAPLDVNSGYSAPVGSDPSYLDHQKVRMEALRKLGLLKSEEEESGALKSPKFSPKTRRSWAAPSTPISPKSPPTTPSYNRVHSNSLASVRPSLCAPRAASLDILPAPPAFSDCTDSLPSDSELSPVSDLSDGVTSLKPLTPSALIKQLSPPRGKSVTLDRTGLGLSSYIASQNIGDRRNSRPRPASLGAKKELSSTEGEDAEAEEEDDGDDDDDSSEPDMWVTLPPPSAPSNANDLQKLPRSQGVSVLISPRAENDSDRREALRKLGLLRD